MKYIICLIIFSIFLCSFSVVYASTICYDPFCTDGMISERTGLGDTDPVLIVSRIINGAFTVLGVVSLVLVLYGGAIWMLARGNEEEVRRAQEILKGAVIGLVIIMASYSIANFVFYNLTLITNAR